MSRKRDEGGTGVRIRTGERSEEKNSHVSPEKKERFRKGKGIRRPGIKPTINYF